MYDEEEEGEYLDDPISLIFDAVDAGAVVDLSTSSDDEAEDIGLPPRSSYGNKNFCLPVTFFNITRNVELLKKCKAPSIKLVDCGKHPNYKGSFNLKQPQSHITYLGLEKTSFGKEPKNDAAYNKSLVIEEIGKKHDKVLVKDESFDAQKNINENKEGMTNIIKFKSPQEVSDQKIVMSETKRKQVQNEKRQALNCKDLTRVDFKRNTGLVGLTISKKDFPKKANAAKTTDKKIKKDKTSNSVMKDISETLKTLGTVFIPLSNKNPEPLKAVNNGCFSKKPSKEMTRGLLDAKNQIVEKNEKSPTYCSLKLTSSKLLKKALKLKQAKEHQNKAPSKEKPKESDKDTVEIIDKDHKHSVKRNKEPSKDKTKENVKNTVEIIAKDHKNPVENNAKDQAVPKLNLKRKYTETNVFYIVNNTSKLQCDDTGDPNNKTKKAQEPQKKDKIEPETNEVYVTRSNSPILPCTTNLNTSSYTKTMARKETKKANDGKKVKPLSYKSNTDNYLKTLQAINSVHRYTTNDNIPSKPAVSVPLKNQVNSSVKPCPVPLNQSHLEPHLPSQIGMRVATPLESAIVNETILQSQNGLTKTDITINSQMTVKIAGNEPMSDEASLFKQGCKKSTMQSLPILQACHNSAVNSNPTLTRILQTSPKTVVSLQKGDETNIPREGYSKNMIRTYTPPCPNEAVNNLPVKRHILQAIQETALNLQKAGEPSLPGENDRSGILRASSNTHSCAHSAVNSIPPIKRPISETAPESVVNLPKGNDANLPGEGNRTESIHANNNSVLKRPICYYSPDNTMSFKGTPARPLYTSINSNDGYPIETFVNHRQQVHIYSEPRQNQGRSLRILGPCLFPPPNTNIAPPGMQISHNNPGLLLRLPNEHTNVLTHHMPPSFWRPAMLQNQYFPPDQVKAWRPSQPENVNISATPAGVEIPKESILGSDANGELIKKINIAAMSACKTTPVKNKEKMLEFLNQSIEDQIDAVTPTKIEKVINDLKLKKEVDVTKSNNCKPCPLSKKNNSNNLLKPTIAQNVAKEIAEKMPAKGYSPPILPIPTYQQAFHIMARKEKIMHNVKKHNALTDNQKLDKISIKRKLPKQEKAKKISIDEYKKRINGKEGASKSKDSKRKCKTQDLSKNVTVDNSQDLGYDSDSTVILDSNN